MDDEFDDILMNRIREVFDNFEDPSADQGWLLLREKFPEEQAKRRAFAWLWSGSAAAVLLLFLGIGLLINNNQHTKPEKLSRSKAKYSRSQHKNLAVTDSRRDRSSKPNADSEKKPAINQTTNKPAASSTLLTNRQKSNQPVSDKTVLSDDDAARVTNNIAFKSNKIIGDTAQNNSPIVSVPSNPATDKAISTVKTPAKSIDAMFAKDQATKAKSDEKGKNKKVNFGIYAATYFNYAKGSNNQVNLGGGITSDIKLTKNLKLVTGIAIGQNTLNYNTNAPQAILTNGDRLASGLAANSSRYAAAAVTAPPTALKSYNASLVGLDIPVNLKYELNPQKNDTYISAGLSSGTFINEAYTYRYVYPALPSITQQNATTRTNFNTFYFAKTLDVAFGIGYPFGKNTRLIIEPFLKYPLQSLGSQQIRFGAGGLNLKLNFQSFKR